MSEIKKTILYFFIALLLLGCAFAAGFRTCNHREEVRANEYQERIDNLEGELEAERELRARITDGLRWSARAVFDIAEKNRIITAEYRRIIDGLGNLGTGISEDLDRVENLIGRLDEILGDGGAEREE